MTTSDVGRNDPCPCGSTKKYKKCCLAKGRPADSPARSATAPRGEAMVPPEKLPTADWVPSTTTDLRNAVTKQRAHRTVQEDDPDDDYVRDEEGRLTKDQKETVNGWWREFDPVYKKLDTDEMIRSITNFMVGHPDLFIHLGLDEQCLFDLEGELRRIEKYDRYVELLQRIRKDQPLAYKRAHGFFDKSIIADLIVNGRRAEVPAYFELFKEEPDARPDELSEIVNILTATNCDAELFDLVRAVATPVYESPHVVGGEFALDWVIFEAFLLALEPRDTSESGVHKVREKLKKAELPVNLNFDSIAEDIRDTLGTFTDARDLNFGSKKERTRFYVKVMRHFTAWLHAQEHLSWPSARYFAAKVGDYLVETATGKKGAQPFHFHYARLDQYVAETCKRLFWIDGVRALSLLQGVWWFAPYMAQHGVFDEGEVRRVQAASVKLADLVKKAVDVSDDGPRIFPDLSHYRWAAPPATATSLPGKT